MADINDVTTIVYTQISGTSGDVV